MQIPVSNLCRKLLSGHFSDVMVSVLGQSMLIMWSLEFPFKALTFETPAGTRVWFLFQGSNKRLCKEKKGKANTAKLFVEQKWSIFGLRPWWNTSCRFFLVWVIFKFNKLRKETPELISFLKGWMFPWTSLLLSFFQFSANNETLWSLCQFYFQFCLKSWHQWGYFVNFGATDNITRTFTQIGIPQNAEKVIDVEDLLNSHFMGILCFKSIEFASNRVF